MSLLEVTGLNSYYGDSHILFDVSMRVEKHEVVALKGSFHGRLMGTRAVTDRPSYPAPFRPLMPGAHIVPAHRAFVDAEIERVLLAEHGLAEDRRGKGNIRPLDERLVEPDQGVPLAADEQPHAEEHGGDGKCVGQRPGQSAGPGRGLLGSHSAVH